MSRRRGAKEDGLYQELEIELERIRKRTVLAALFHSRGRIQETATRLGCSRRTLLRDLTRWGVDKRDWNKFAPRCDTCDRPKREDEGFIRFALVGPHGRALCELVVCGPCYDLRDLRRPCEDAIRTFVSAAVAQRSKLEELLKTGVETELVR